MVKYIRVICLKLTVYIDVLIAVNTIINYFLLKICAILSGAGTNTKRMIISSFTGSLFSLFIFCDLKLLLSLAIKLLSVVICAAIAFGIKSKKYFIKNVICLGFINCLVTGFINLFLSDSNYIYINNIFYYININPVMLVIAITFVYFSLYLYDLFFDINARQREITIGIYIDKSFLKLNGFYDTGFKVKDIIGGRAVMLVAFPEVENHIGENLKNKLSSFFAGNINTGKIIPVFYSDVSGGGILPGVKPDKVIYKNKELENILIAFCNKSLGNNVRMIFGKDIYNKTGE